MLGFIRKYFLKRKELKKYEYGDIIWCDVKKYGNKFNFSKGHQIRPYLFVNYKKGKIYCYALTHNDKVNSLSYIMQQEPLERVILSCLFELKVKCYVRYHSRMGEDDLSRISKIIYNMHNDEAVREKIIKHIRIERNDIVLYKKNKYLVYANDKDTITLYEITNNKLDLYVENGKDKYYISSKPIIAKKSNGIMYVDTFKYDVARKFNTSRIEKKKKEASKNKTCLLKRGDIFKTNSGTFVVLNTEGEYIYYTKYNNPDYEIRMTKYKSQKSIGNAQEYKIIELEKEIEKICNSLK